MSALKNHPNKWLRDDASDMFDKYEADHGIIDVTSAGRTIAQQQALIDRWNRGGTYNRPPYLYQPAMPAATSNHVISGGIAIDTNDWKKFATVCLRYGFVHTYPSGDPVHFDFRGHKVIVEPNDSIRQKQAYLNAARGEHLVVDGLNGDRTKAAVKRYQTFLRKYGYTGAIDGIWGSGTEKAHLRYYHFWTVG